MGMYNYYDSGKKGYRPKPKPKPKPKPEQKETYTGIEINIDNIDNTDIDSRKKITGVTIDMNDIDISSPTEILSIEATGDMKLKGDLLIEGEVKQIEKEVDLDKEIKEKEDNLKKIQEARIKIIKKCFDNLGGIIVKNVNDAKIGYYSYYKLSASFIKYINKKEKLSKEIKKIFKKFRCDISSDFYTILLKLDNKYVIDLPYNKWYNVKQGLELTDKYKKEYLNKMKKKRQKNKIKKYENEYNKLTGAGVVKIRKKIEVKICEECQCENLLRAIYCAFCGKEFRG